MPVQFDERHGWLMFLTLAVSLGASYDVACEIADETRQWVWEQQKLRSLASREIADQIRNSVLSTY